MNLLSHLATCWVVNMSLLKNVVCVRAYKNLWDRVWVHLHMHGCVWLMAPSASPTYHFAHISPFPKESGRGREGGRPPIGLVRGSRLGCPWQSLEVRCFVDGFLMTPVWLQAHCTALSDRQMGKADELIWRTRKEWRGVFFSVHLIEIPFLPKRFRENHFFWCCLNLE